MTLLEDGAHLFLSGRRSGHLNGLDLEVARGSPAGDPRPEWRGQDHPAPAPQRDAAAHGRAGVAWKARQQTIRATGWPHWRRQVGLVLQDADDQLFAASVAEDVSFGPINLGPQRRGGASARARNAERRCV